MGVAVDQGRDQRRARGVDLLVAEPGHHLRPDRLDPPRLAADGDGFAVEPGAAHGQRHRLTSRRLRAAAAPPPGRRAGGSRWRAVVLQPGDVELARADPVGEVVDDAERRVVEAELAGDHALGGDRHPDHVGVGGDQPHLGGSLEAGPQRLPVDAAVARRLAARLPGREDFGPPARVEARRRVGTGVGEDRGAEVEGDEVVGAEQAADRQLRAERADRADREHAIAALLGQRPQVGGVVDLVREDVGRVGEAVALDDRRPVLGRRRGDLLAAGPEGVAAEDHRQSSHRPILRGALALAVGLEGRRGLVVVDDRLRVVEAGEAFHRQGRKIALPRTCSSSGR